MPRLFFALLPSPPQRTAMHDAALSLVRRTGGRPVAAEDLHLTLCFLGQVPEGRIDALIAAAEGIESTGTSLALDRADLWRRSCVLCLLPSPGEEVDRIGRLAAELTAAVRSIGLTPDQQPFRPHVTLARKLPAEAFRSESWPKTLPAPLTLSTGGFALMSSIGAGDGPRYKMVHAWGDRHERGRSSSSDWS